MPLQMNLNKMAITESPHCLILTEPSSSGAATSCHDVTRVTGEGR
jgi:hypothetical protein